MVGVRDERGRDGARMSASYLGVRVGDRVVLLRLHPSAGHSGRGAQFENVPGSFGDQTLVVVELDSGRRVSVWDASQIQRFGADERRRL